MAELRKQCTFKTDCGQIVTSCINIPVPSRATWKMESCELPSKEKKARQEIP